MYGDFASVYDRLMRDVDYGAWARHYRRLLGKAGVPDGARVLEGACGTGNMTLALAPHYRLTPGDASSEMLTVAANKARQAGLALDFTRQDLRRLAAHRPVDAVLAACDGVNYLLTEKDLRRFLRSAFRALRPGGALAFDLSSLDKLSRLLPRAPQVMLEEDVAYAWLSRWDKRTRRLHMELAVFVRRPDGAFDRVVEHQVQRAWERAEIEAALLEAGFEAVRCYGDLTLRAPGSRARRLHFLAQKPKE